MTLVFRISHHAKDAAVTCGGTPVNVRQVASGLVGSIEVPPGRHTYRIDAHGPPGATWSASVTSASIVQRHLGVFGDDGGATTGEVVF